MSKYISHSAAVAAENNLAPATVQAAMPRRTSQRRRPHRSGARSARVLSLRSRGWEDFAAVASRRPKRDEGQRGWQQPRLRRGDRGQVDLSLQKENAQRRASALDPRGPCPNFNFRCGKISARSGDLFAAALACAFCCGRNRARYIVRVGAEPHQGRVLWIRKRLTFQRSIAFTSNCRGPEWSRISGGDDPEVLKENANRLLNGGCEFRSAPGKRDHASF